jgi:predicted amidophosphoribosyltransferase
MVDRHRPDETLHMGWWTALVDLVWPGGCAGCGASSAHGGVCRACQVALAAGPTPVRPRGAPRDLPPCVAAGTYDGPARAVILSYKERGQRLLAAALGRALAVAVRTGLGNTPRSWPVVLVPVPSTAAAVRARYGDHMLGVARHTADRLVALGWSATVVAALHARPKDDSTHLDRLERAAAARSAFELRPDATARLSAAGAADGVVVALDDVLTTGATLAAVARLLATAGAPVAFAATVAATALRGSPERITGKW